MDVSMVDMAVKALEIMLDPTRLAFLAGGVVIGLALGVIPGLGGLVGLSLLLPFTYHMDPYTALAFLMGLSAVSATSDTIPAVMFGVPGTVASAATILDGFPMAKKGEAGRAYGAAFTASVIGGCFGALLLAVSIPVLRPFILSITSSEMLAFCIFGLSLVAVLSGGSPLKGLSAVCIGLMAATVGDHPQTGTLRWAFDSLYLFDGLPVVPIALGLFALPEIADMAIQRKAIQSAGPVESSGGVSQWQGVKDVFKSPFLVLRCASIGAGLGAVPGVGATVIDWIAYGHAARTEKGAAKTFGKGDVRGVIASESSNNAKEGGSLVPTIAFGVPGTASMALILGAMLIHGIIPGPEMLGAKLDVTYTMVWSVALANIIGAGICFAFANTLAKLALVRIGILAPVVLAVVFIGAFQGKQSWGDLFVLLGFGLLGFVMKRLRWPRPPLLLGFVLGGLVERYLFISHNVYGWDWIYRPVVMIVLAFTLFGLLRPIVAQYWKRSKEATGPPVRLGFQRRAINADIYFAAAVCAMFVAAIIYASRWEEGARLTPDVICIVGIIFTGLLIVTTVFVAPPPVPEVRPGQVAADDGGAHYDLVTDFGDLTRGVVRRRAGTYFGWCVFYVAAGAVVGLLPAMFLFVAGYMRFIARERWTLILSVAVPLWVGSYVLFHEVLHVKWPRSLIGEIFPDLRAIPSLALF